MQETRYKGFCGEGLLMRGKQSVFAAILASCMFLSLGTGARAAVTMLDQATGITVGTSSAPAFADIDGDGDLDAFIGAADGTVSYYKNNGSGIFSNQTGTWFPATKTGNPFNSFNDANTTNISGGDSSATYSAPGFADLDNDGDLDAFVGQYDGTIRCFLNNGSGVFTEQFGTANPFNSVNAGTSSSIAFADIDRDGDLDAFAGAGDGTIRYIVNNGNNVFSEQTGTWNPATKAGNPFSSVNVVQFSAIAFADLGDDGNLDAFIGNTSGTVLYYVNDGSDVFTPQTGTWDPATMSGNPFDGLTPSLDSSFPAFGDLDNDGDPDAFIGSGIGSVSYFKNMNAAPSFSSTPVISGTAAAGSTLGLVNTDATDADGDTVTLSYQWKANDAPIASAITASYTITAAEAHKTIKCTIIAHDAYGGRDSTTTVGVIVGNTAPVFSSVPAISGTGAAGNTLSLVNTGTTDVDGDTVTLSYKWEADNVTITGATGSTYVVTTAVVSKSITCVITANDGHGGTTPITTAGVTATPGGDINNDGTVNTLDALKTLRIAVGIDSATTTDKLRADVAPLVNNIPQPDGFITIADAVVVLRKVVGLW